MRLEKRLERLESKGRRMEPVFLPVGSPIADVLDYVGIRECLRLERGPNESTDKFRARCLTFDRKYRNKEQLPIFFDICL